MKPWRIKSFFVFGASDGGWFKMISVDKDGKKLESRKLKGTRALMSDSMSASQLQAAWDAATTVTGSSSYSVEVTVGDTTKPPARKINQCPKAGDAEGTVYFSNMDPLRGDEPTTGWRSRLPVGRRSTIRRRMRGSFYTIAPEVNYKLVKKGATCRSRNKYYGCWLKTAADCAKKVKKEGKKYFIWNPGTKALSYHDAKCYGESTTSESCPEGFSTHGGYNKKYSFYSVLA